MDSDLTLNNNQPIIHCTEGDTKSEQPTALTKIHLMIFNAVFTYYVLTIIGFGDFVKNCQIKNLAKTSHYT